MKEVKNVFAKEGYRVQDSIYINGKTPIKITCPKKHETAISLNNFMNGRRCNLCRRITAIEARMKKLELKANKERLPPREASSPFAATGKPANESADQVKPEWLAKLDEMRKNLKSAKRRTYRE